MHLLSPERHLFSKAKKTKDEEKESEPLKIFGLGFPASVCPLAILCLSPLTLTPSLPSDNLSDFILNSTKGKLRWTLKPPPSHPSTHTHTESPILVSWNLSFHP